jgi:Tol biopolymer transport system component/DNA-binding winged helix-turn-helix (wHTH) protein
MNMTGEYSVTSQSVGKGRIRFDVYEADLRTEELTKSGRKIRLPNQAFHVLAILLNRAGDLVTREELCEQLWPAAAFLEHDGSLNAAVNRLREALGDSAERPRFIETLPRRGYRFVAAIDRVHAPVAIELTEDCETLASDFSQSPKRPAPRARFVVAVVISGVFVVAVVATILSSRSQGHRALGREIVPFTSLPGQAVTPTFSPDGSQIAFAWNGNAGANQQFDLYVKTIGSDRILRVTNTPSAWISAAWSPDGTSISFVRTNEGTTGIYVVPALGGAERRIVGDAVGVGHFIQLGWSPDGKLLAYSRYGSNGAQQIFTVNLETLVSQPLAPAPTCWDAAEPAYSPDGTQLAFICTSSVAKYDIYISSIPAGRLQPLASMSGKAQGLTWSADGQRIIFSNDSGDGGALWSLTLDGQLTQLSFGESGTGPVIRGSRLAYIRGRNTINIWRFDLTNSHPEDSAKKLLYSTRAQIEPSYSHDGSRIVFQSNRSGRTEIWVADAEGTDATRVTSFNGPFTSSPSWCSDGRRIAFDSIASGMSAVYIDDINERLPRAVDAARPNLSLPVWSEDCRWLIASDGRTALYRVPIAGGPAQRFTDLPAARSTVSGDSVVFAVMHPSGVTLWSKPVNGGPEREVENLPLLTYADAWATSLTGIFYTVTSSRPISIYEYKFADHTSKPVMTIQSPPEPGNGPGIAVSPDGHWLLVTQIDDAQSEIMLGPSP